MRYSSIIIIIIMLSVSIASGQDSPIDKGSWTASGGFSYINRSGRAKLITIDPTVSHFIAPGLALGASFLFIDEPSSYRYNRRTLGFGPSIQYFYNTSRDNTLIRGSLYPYCGVAVLFTNDEYESYDYSSDRNTMTYTFGGGLLAMISDNAGVFGEYVYMERKTEGYSGRSTNIIAAGFSYFIY